MGLLSDSKNNSMNEMPESSIKALPARRWRKVLYEDQGVPDNYVDESFLDEMKKNRKFFFSFAQWSILLLDK